MKSSRNSRVILLLVVLGAAAAIALPLVHYYSKDKSQPTGHDNSQGDPQPQTAPAQQDDPPVAPANGNATGEGSGSTVAPPPANNHNAGDSNAPAAYQAGLGALAAGDLLKARALLSEAYFSGKLSAEQQKRARDELTTLAKTTLIGSPMAYPNDPLTGTHTVAAGSNYTRIERQLGLRVPTQLLERVNGTPASALRAGQNIKIIRGPFHAIVDKSDFTMDVYVKDPDGRRIYVTRLAVGTGANDRTPAGTWRVKEKLIRPPYTPAANSPLAGRGTIAYGQPDYAFGAKGLWIALEGLDQHNATMRGYGIHSTDKPASIGKAESEGCIRMADDDIELVYSLLYETLSTVEIRE